MEHSAVQEMSMNVELQMQNVCLVAQHITVIVVSATMMIMVFKRLEHVKKVRFVSGSVLYQKIDLVINPGPAYPIYSLLLKTA